METVSIWAEEAQRLARWRHLRVTDTEAEAVQLLRLLDARDREQLIEQLREWVLLTKVRSNG